jgi:spoIIIJ-associated protein
MVQEFEGRSEKEAIEVAARELGLERDAFDVEILEAQSGGIFKKGKVRIRVHAAGAESPRPARTSPIAEPLPADEFEAKILEFTKRLVEGMGYTCEVAILFREEKKLGIRIDSEHASIIIGKKGKNLDALQLLVNVYAGRLGREDTRVILDSENYRIRREESLVRLAYETAEEVRKRRQSVLLEPMNPFERRIIHTTLNDIVDIETKSEGEGLYKQVRVFFRGRP